VVASKITPDKADGLIVPLVYNNGTGWIGFFCINKGHRGKGWGRTLFAAALDRFENTGTKIIGLDAVSEQVQTYGRRGFVEKNRVRLYERRPIRNIPSSSSDDVVLIGGKIVTLSSLPEHVIVESDLKHSGLQRSRLWTKEALLSRSDFYGLAVMSDTSEELRGWIVVRSCEHGYRVGPLYADSTSIASRLLSEATKNLQNKPSATLIAELWVGNPKASAVFTAAGWTEVGIDYHRMWLGGRLPKEQDSGGKADSDTYAIFDAGEG